MSAIPHPTTTHHNVLAAFENGLATAGRSGQRKTLRVLCAEDDETLAQTIKHALEGAGHVVDCVEDGQTALARLLSTPAFYHVLLTDHQMPRLTGLGLVAKLRDTTFSGTIIVHSASLSRAEANAYRALAVDHILSKPAELADLLAIMQRLQGNCGAGR